MSLRDFVSEEITQYIEYLLCGPEDLSLDPNTYVKAMSMFITIAKSEELDIHTSRNFLPSQSRKMATSMFNERPFLKS